MSDSIRQELQQDLHAASLGESVTCDYHHSPQQIEDSDQMLLEVIRLVDHPQLQVNEWTQNWTVDATRCEQHTVDEIAYPTRGFQEALVELPIQEINNVVSIDTPTPDDISVLAFESAAEGSYPMVLDQKLQDSAPGDMGLSRWVRVDAMLEANGPLKQHVENLIDQSIEPPIDG